MANSNAAAINQGAVQADSANEPAESSYRRRARSRAGTVTVACKVPMGLYLRLFNMAETQEPVLGGGFRTTKMAQQVGESVKIKGPSHAVNKAPAALIAGGYAITIGVDKDFWDEWLQQNRDSDIVKNQLIFAHGNADAAEDRALEQEEVLSGMHPLNVSLTRRNGREVVTDRRVPNSRFQIVPALEGAERID